LNYCFKIWNDLFKCHSPPYLAISFVASAFAIKVREDKIKLVAIFNTKNVMAVDTDKLKHHVQVCYKAKELRVAVEKNLEGEKMKGTIPTNKGCQYSIVNFYCPASRLGFLVFLAKAHQQKMNNRAIAILNRMKRITPTRKPHV
jgi:hypothetical protein